MGPRPIFVVGCPRSGTSLFARWLAASGLETARDPRTHARYPTGYYEHLPLLMFHKGLERLPRGGDHRITAEPFLTAETLDEPFAQAGFELAFRPALDASVDFIKFPQLALSVDFLFERFPAARIVGIWREPRSVFRSLVVNELPKDMIPASGVKAVLLWNLYAHHLVRAKKGRPDSVTLVNIDAFISGPDRGGCLMESLGRPATTAAPVATGLDRTLWRERPSPTWRAYHAAMAGLCQLLGPVLGEERRALCSERRWRQELAQLTDF